MAKTIPPVTSSAELTEALAAVNKGGRPVGSTRPRLPARQAISAMTDKLADMISRQVDLAHTDIAKLDKQRSEQPIVDPTHVSARIEIAQALAGLTKTLVTIQGLRSKAGEEDGDGEGELSGESVVNALMSESSKSRK